MRMELTENGCLKILLSGEDLDRYQLSFETLDYRDETTRETLEVLMQTAADRFGFLPAKHLLIEALPVDDGCLLLITPERSTGRVRLKKAPGPYIYRVEDTDRLLQLARGLGRLREQGDGELARGSSSLYRDGTGYRLVLYPGGPLSSPLRLMLDALARKTGEGDAAAAFACEHGVPVAVGNALNRLLEAYSA